MVCLADETHSGAADENWIILVVIIPPLQNPLFLK